MGRGRLALALLLLAGPEAAAQAQPAVVSPGPEAVSVTVYRDPNGRRQEDWNLDWLDGYALVSETRTVRLPAGDSVVRFEGVAGGIVPASAIVHGLPGGVGEKNRDARLISPGTLIDAALGRRVHIRRTNARTGRVTETDAVIRSGPEGVVLQTADGFEALRCTGLPETLTYDAVPEGLSDKPTLAVTAHLAEATTAQVRLTYLATGFDWQASYVAHIRPGGSTLELFAWLTLANSNDESFEGARANAIAGDLNKNEDGDGEAGEPIPVSSEIKLECWPQGTTSDAAVKPPGPPQRFDEAESNSGDSIVVTGSRRREVMLESASAIAVVTAQQEELGDLKLYRIPIPVTVAAHSQKQVALLSRSEVPFERLYGLSIPAGEVADEGDAAWPAHILLRMKNLKEKGLGLPLPQGSVSVFETVNGASMLAGETRVRDYAVGEAVELEVAESPDVQVVQRLAPRGKAGGEAENDDDDYKPRRYEVEITNARPVPVTLELVLRLYERQVVEKPSRKLGRKDGRHMWLAHVPANGTATLRYTLKRLRPPPDPEEDGED
ncbi:MAG TPA: hypothetical protein VGD66_12575 [Allosphingosinicella sp.]|jgi:hypothetical protein